MPLNWNATKKDRMLISQIAKRFVEYMHKEHNLHPDLDDINMDIAAVHLNDCKLRLKELLEADQFNFNHDMFGIREHLNRETGKLKNCFLPRFAK